MDIKLSLVFSCLLFGNSSTRILRCYGPGGRSFLPYNAREINQPAPILRIVSPMPLLFTSPSAYLLVSSNLSSHSALHLQLLPSLLSIIHLPSSPLWLAPLLLISRGRNFQSTLEFTLSYHRRCPFAKSFSLCCSQSGITHHGSKADAAAAHRDHACHQNKNIYRDNCDHRHSNQREAERRDRSDTRPWLYQLPPVYEETSACVLLCGTIVLRNKKGRYL
jgi:hypothetical protein